MEAEGGGVRLLEDGVGAVLAVGHSCDMVESFSEVVRSVWKGSRGVSLFHSCVQQDKAFVFEEGCLLYRIVLVCVFFVLQGHDFNDREDVVGQYRCPFGFVVGRARDVLDELGWGESQDMVDRLAFVVGDGV